MQTVLAGIEQRLTNDMPAPMQCDRWLAASVMQKAIRRGETERALQAAVALWQQDKQRFWRRVHIIAMEDIGPADTQTVIEALCVIPETRWRKQVGDLRVGLVIVRLLCAAPKCRLADHAYIIAERGVEYAGARNHLASLSPSVLQDMALNNAVCLPERLLAMWFIAGTKRYPSDYLPYREGSLDDGIAVIEGMNVPPNLITACQGVMRKTPWPLALFMPLLWVETKTHPKSVKVNSLSPIPDVNGIPLYGVDWFTRVGRTSINQLQKTVPAFKQFTGQQIGLAWFYYEGGKVDKELTSPALDAFKQQGELADIESTGLDIPRYLGLLELIEQHWPQFDDIRAKQLKRYHDERAAEWALT